MRNNLIVIVDSLTGLSKRFADRLGFEVIDIHELIDHVVTDQFFLVTRSTGFGEIPEDTVKLLNQCANLCCGCAVSGNRNWGKNYGAAGDKIAELYQIPLVCKFEGSGFNSDLQIVLNYLKEYQHE